MSKLCYACLFDKMLPVLTVAVDTIYEGWVVFCVAEPHKGCIFTFQNFSFLQPLIHAVQKENPDMDVVMSHFLFYFHI